MTDPQSVVETAPVVVTGANRNVGTHLAHRFLDDGFAVIAQYRTPTQAIADLADRGALPIQGDFADTDSILAVADAIAGRASRIRALIHNASAFSPTDDDAEAASAQFQAFFEVHMRAPYLLNTRLADRVRAAEGAGDIVHITDIYADNPAPPYDIYCATKAGLQNLAIAFAKRLAPEVKVNVIQPGPITFEDWADAEQRAQVLDSTPLGRTGAPEDIYRAVRAVLDNDYQTGAMVAVDGGRRLGR
ncbi:SDR family oxidoreductase [Salinisphaera sp. LB1]|uniref:SDR family oxidoreductase n=1 Tax=Salinisphaera sp. LB1 TaxID=2183911 RepID=UPI000D7085D0|nr:SDR family oxidoreductase [Salinisphaera sp. LB1]AWN14751.1 FolM Alternative dihydrofolate reductase 1 [Salinisphaera sp. LB1]